MDPLLLIFRLSLAVINAGVLVAIPFFARSESDFGVLFLGWLTTVVVSLPVFLRRNYSLFEPLSFVILLVLFGTTFKLLYIVDQRNDNYQVLTRLLLWNEPGVFLYGLSLLSAGMLCLVIGYHLRLPRWSLFRRLLMPRNQRWHGPRLQFVLFALTIVSLACLVMFIVAAGVRFTSLEDLSSKRFVSEAGSTAQRMFDVKYYLYRGASISKFIVYLALIWILAKKKPFRSIVGWLLLAAVLQTVLLFFIMNTRANIALLFLDMAVISYYMGMRLTLAPMFIGGVAVCASLLAMLYSRSGTDANIGELMEKTFCSRDLLDVTKTCHIINAIPDKMDYRNGEMLYAWMFSWIPKSAWEQRPMWAECGLFINQKVYGDTLGISGVPPGMVADLYWNFGIVGIPLGMLLMGILLRYLFENFRPFFGNPTAVLMYSIVVTRFTIFGLGLDLGTGIVKTVLDLIPLVLIVWFIGRPSVRRAKLAATQ